MTTDTVVLTTISLSLSCTVGRAGARAGSRGVGGGDRHPLQEESREGQEAQERRGPSSRTTTDVDRYRGFDNNLIIIVHGWAGGGGGVGG